MITKELLTELYCNKQMTQKEIAILLGYDQGNLCKLMTRLGIPARSYSESQKLYWTSGADISKQEANLVRGFNKGLEMPSKQKAKIAKSNQGKHWHRACKLRPEPNRIEKVLLDVLNRNCPGEWGFAGDGSVIIGGLCPDFININGKKLVIEVFGSYWHGSRRKLRVNQTVEGRIAAFKAFGFNTLVLWDYEIDQLPEAELVDRIAMLEAM